MNSQKNRIRLQVSQRFSYSQFFDSVYTLRSFQQHRYEHKSPAHNGADNRYASAFFFLAANAFLYGLPGYFERSRHRHKNLPEGQSYPDIQPVYYAF